MRKRRKGRERKEEMKDKTKKGGDGKRLDEERKRMKSGKKGNESEEEKKG